jgi:ABC-2 type transport system permease protein
MAVYKRGYQPYEGTLTPQWSRFLLIARSSCRHVFDSKFMITFFVVAFIYPVVMAGLLYLPHNAGAAALLQGRRVLSPDALAFLRFLSWQGTLAFMLTGFLGPGLVAPDLANNALPLYFSRPFSRAEYVLGKMAVLAILISAITWAPGLLLFGFAAYLEGGAWLAANLWMVPALLAASWIWIVALCLLAMATSAWVRWRIAAGALIFGLFFVVAGFGEAINHSLHTRAGNLVNIAAIIRTIWRWLFGVPPDTGLSPAAALLALAAGCGACYWLLARKLRAYHVERA